MACQDLVCITRPACQPAAPGGWSGLYFVAKDSVATILYEQVLGLKKGLVSGFTLVSGASLLSVDFENTNTGLVFDSDSASGSNAYAHTVTATLDWKDKESRAAAMLLQSTQVILIAIAKDQGRVMMVGDKREGARLDVNTNANGSLGTDANTRTLTFTLQNDMDQIEMLIPPPSNPTATEDERRDYTFDYVQELVNCGTTAGTTNCEPGDESISVAFDALSGAEVTSTDNGDGTSTLNIPLDITVACCEETPSVQWYDTGTNSAAGTTVTLNGEDWVVGYLPDALTITGPTGGNEFENVVGRYSALFSACSAQSLLPLGSLVAGTGALLSDFSASFLGIGNVELGAESVQIDYVFEILNSGCTDANFTFSSISIDDASDWSFSVQTFPMPAEGQTSEVTVQVVRSMLPEDVPLGDSIRFDVSTENCGTVSVNVPLSGCDFNVGQVSVVDDPTSANGAYNEPITFVTGAGNQAVPRDFKLIGDNCCEGSTPTLTVQELSGNPGFSGSLITGVNVNAGTNQVQIEYSDTLANGSYVLQVSLALSACNTIQWYIPVTVAP